MFNKKQLLCVFLCFFSQYLIGAVDSAVKKNVVHLSETQNTVEFLAIGNPGFLKIKGQLQGKKTVTGQWLIENSVLKGSAQVNLADFDTGIELRNEHMKKKYLQIEQFPESTLIVEPIPFVMSEAGVWEGPFSGTLKLHGVEKKVSGTAKLSQKSAKWEGSFEFNFILKDFGVETPSWLGVSVTKEIKVSARFQQ